MMLSFFFQMEIMKCQRKRDRHRHQVGRGKERVDREGAELSQEEKDHVEQQEEIFREREQEKKKLKDELVL